MVKKTLFGFIQTAFLFVGAFYATWMLYPNYRTPPCPSPAPNYAPVAADNAAFSGAFLVRPTLLPYGKRGFRAAITKLRALSRLRRRCGSKKVPSPLNFSAASAAAQRRRPGSSRWGWRPKCRPRPRRLRADRPAPRACPGRSPSAPPTCPAAE